LCFWKVYELWVSFKPRAYSKLSCTKQKASEPEKKYWIK
jgi:hypothetical protein